MLFFFLLSCVSMEILCRHGRRSNTLETLSFPKDFNIYDGEKEEVLFSTEILKSNGCTQVLQVHVANLSELDGNGWGNSITRYKSYCEGRPVCIHTF